MTGEVESSPTLISPNVEVSRSVPEGWDAFVDGHPGRTAYHRGAAVLLGHKVFGLDTTFLTARAQGRIVGALPLVLQSSLVFGRFLTSVPFFTYGGILARDASVARALANAAANLAKSHRARHVELRHTAACPGLDLPQRRDKVSMVLDLPSSESELARALGSKLRSQIKRAEREHPEILWGGAELVPEFYTVFAERMRDLGTPVYPKRFFQIACESFAAALSVLVIRVGGRAQAVAMIVRHGTTIEVPWAAASDAGKPSGLNMRLYWELLAQSIRERAAAFDFGRSSVDSGTYRFKAQWGATPRQLHWDYILPSGGAPPVLNHSNPKFELATRLWKRLPLPFANALGPFIIRSLP